MSLLGVIGVLVAVDGVVAVAEGFTTGVPVFTGVTVMLVEGDVGVGLPLTEVGVFSTRGVTDEAGVAEMLVEGDVGVA